MKITIITTGRFHVGSLARELGILGHDVTLCSYVPKFKEKDFDLNHITHKSYFRFLLPFIAGQRMKNKKVSNVFNKLLVLFYDFWLSKTLPSCDVLIFMSGIFIKTPTALKEKFNCNIVVERGSTHILTQSKILSEILSYEPVSDFFIKRELEGYDVADLISVPADHTRDSFLENGIPREKIIQNPYGVNLESFHLSALPTNDRPTVIIVGNWCLRKGADLILKTMELLPEYKLLHVGAITDVPFPFQNPQFQHIDPVPEKELALFYAQAHVFILPSREEGLALVQLQALACGLPVVHTYRTGASDLKSYISNQDIIITVESDPLSLSEGVKSAYNYRLANQGINPLDQNDRAAITWSAYARRYEQHLHSNFKL